MDGGNSNVPGPQHWTERQASRVVDMRSKLVLVVLAASLFACVGAGSAPDHARLRGDPIVQVTVPVLMFHRVRALDATSDEPAYTWSVSPAALDAHLTELAARGYLSITL